MSLCNALIDSDTRAFLLVDSAGMLDGVQHLNASKLRVLAASHAVFSIRGMDLAIEPLALRINLANLPFDALVDAIPEKIAQTYAELEQVIERAPESVWSLDVTLAGWSTKHKRMQAHYFAKPGRDAPIDSKRDVTGYMAPAISLPNGGECSGIEDLVTIAHAQRRWCAEHQPEVLPGGPLYLATITPQSMTITKAGELPDLSTAVRAAA